MQINKTFSGIAAASAANSSAAINSENSHQAGKDASPSAIRGDNVQISAAARLLAEQNLEIDSGKQSEQLDPARKQEILGRIASGAYSSMEVADHVARAIVGRSDL